MAGSNSGWDAWIQMGNKLLGITPVQLNAFNMEPNSPLGSPFPIYCHQVLTLLYSMLCARLPRCS